MLTREELSSGTERRVPIVGVQDQLCVVVQNRERSESTDEWLRSLMIDDDQISNAAARKHKIQQLPERDQNDPKYFEPTVVSIGPIHHGVQKLLALENKKMKFARDYVRRSEGSLDVMYRKVEEMTLEARNCYADEATEGFDNEALTRMMFLDGCFILQFMYYVVRNKINQMGMISRDIAFVQKDLFLLENQLPFQVLEALMGSQSHKWFEIINGFIQKIVLPPRSEADPRLQNLINFFTQFIFLPGDQGGEHEGGGKYKSRHLLDVMWKRLINETELLKGSLEKNEHYMHRTATELKASGIYFRASQTPCFHDIKFNNYIFYGTLLLPPMVFTDSTPSVLLNLANYEINSGYNIGVSSYICFLDTLIDSGNDVKELEEAGILFNYANSSNEDVARSISEIAIQLVPDERCFGEVKKKIGDHFKIKIQKWLGTWISEGISNHLRSPWTALAAIAAVIALVSSLVQSYLTVNPPGGGGQDNACCALLKNTTKLHRGGL